MHLLFIGLFAEPTPSLLPAVAAIPPDALLNEDNTVQTSEDGQVFILE